MMRLWPALSLIALGVQAQHGIPGIERPLFIPPEQASPWLKPQDPVLVVEHGGEARAYPLQILNWHPVTKDQIGGVPISVTYCPVSDSAMVFDSRIDGRVYDFGVSGMLRQNNLVLHDRQTDSQWQQLTGEAFAGALTGRKLQNVHSQTVPFETFSRSFPRGKVLSRETGHQRDYGRNPYALQEPLESIVAVNEEAYPFSLLRRQGVLEDRRYVVFFLDGLAGVFSPQLEGKRLGFRRKDGRIVDKQTGSAWNLLGIATEGPLAGKRLTPVGHSVSLASTWLATHPKTQMVGRLDGDGRHKALEGIYGRKSQPYLDPLP